MAYLSHNIPSLNVNFSIINLSLRVIIFAGEWLLPSIAEIVARDMAK